MNDKNFKHLSPSKFDFNLIFENFENPQNLIVKIRELFGLVLRCTQRE